MGLKTILTPLSQPSRSEVKLSFKNFPFQVFSLHKAWIPNPALTNQLPTQDHPVPQGSAPHLLSLFLSQPPTPASLPSIYTTHRVLFKWAGSPTVTELSTGQGGHTSHPPPSLPRAALRKERGCMQTPFQLLHFTSPQNDMSIPPQRVILGCWVLNNVA